MKWKKMKGGDAYALISWEFKRPPNNVTVHTTANSLSEILGAIPEHLCDDTDEDEITVAHIGQWLIDEIKIDDRNHPGWTPVRAQMVKDGTWERL